MKNFKFSNLKICKKKLSKSDVNLKLNTIFSKMT